MERIIKKLKRSATEMETVPEKTKVETYDLNEDMIQNVCGIMDSPIFPPCTNGYTSSECALYPAKGTNIEQKMQELHGNCQSEKHISDDTYETCWQSVTCYCDLREIQVTPNDPVTTECMCKLHPHEESYKNCPCNAVARANCTGYYTEHIKTLQMTCDLLTNKKTKFEKNLPCCANKDSLENFEHYNRSCTSITTSLPFIGTTNTLEKTSVDNSNMSETLRLLLNSVLTPRTELATEKTFPTYSTGALHSSTNVEKMTSSESPSSESLTSDITTQQTSTHFFPSVGNSVVTTSNQNLENGLTASNSSLQHSKLMEGLNPLYIASPFIVLLILLLGFALKKALKKINDNESKNGYTRRFD